MTVIINPNAQHAVYAPSSAHRWVSCTASAEAIANLPEQEEGEAAVKGTAAHSELERCIGPLDGEFIEPATALIEPVDPEHPSAMGVARAINFFRQLPSGRVWVERRVALTDRIWGRADLQHWHSPSATLTTLDLKDGFVGVDPDSEQLRIYGAAGMFTHNLPVKWFRNVICQENDFRPVPRVKQSVESVDSLYAWVERIATIPTDPKAFKAGEQCTYCPLFGKCDASKDALTQLGALIAGLMAPEQVTPEQRALFLACQKPIDDAFKGAEKVWLKDALSKGAPAGLKIIMTQKHKAWRNENEARALVLERLGPEALELPTPAQAIKKGIPESIVDAIAPRPEGGPALAFASDKRAEWKQKDAAEMFAGLAGRGAK